MDRRAVKRRNGLRRTSSSAEVKDGLNGAYWSSGVLDRTSPPHRKTHTTHTEILESCIYASLSSRHSTWSRRPSLQEEDERGEAEAEGVGGQRARQVKRRDERARQTAMTLSFECHHSAKDPR